LYTSPGIIRVIKSRMKWEVYVAHMGETEMHTRFWSKNLIGRDPLVGLGIDGEIILEWILVQ